MYQVGHRYDQYKIALCKRIINIAILYWNKKVFSIELTVVVEFLCDLSHWKSRVGYRPELRKPRVHQRSHVIDRDSSGCHGNGVTTRIAQGSPLFCRDSKRRRGWLAKKRVDRAKF